MRASRSLFVWILWLALTSLAVWWESAPQGYLAYSWQWLSHLRYADLWINDERIVMEQYVQPVLAAWAEERDHTSPARELLRYHQGGTPIPSFEWKQIEARYTARGMEVTDRPTYRPAKTSAETADELAAALGEPASLEALYLAVEARLVTCTAPSCSQRPRVAWVYLDLDTGLAIHWPGGNQRQRYQAGESPSLAPTDHTGQAWIESVFASHQYFQALTGDELGIGDVASQWQPVAIGNAKGLLGVDVYWEDAPIRTMRSSVLVYSAWFVLSVFGILIAGLGIAVSRANMRRLGNGVCVTIDIVGWSQIEDVRERFKRQWMLDALVARSFMASTRQKLLRWSTGDGYHVLFVDRWGADIYREAILFVRTLLARWEERLGRQTEMKGASLRIAVGSHGSVVMRRRHGDWIAIGDRIVSAVRIDEVSRGLRDPNATAATIAVEQSFNKEMKLTARAEYEAAIAVEASPFTGTDKSGKPHQFNMLTLKPLVSRTGWLRRRIAAWLESAREQRVAAGAASALSRADESTRAAE